MRYSMTFEGALRSSSCPSLSRYSRYSVSRTGSRPWAWGLCRTVTDVAQAKLKRPYSDSQHL